jgi:hypothetical protein
MNEIVCYAKTARALLWLIFFAALYLTLTGWSERAKKDSFEGPKIVKRGFSHSSEIMTGSLALVIVLDKFIAARDKRVKRALEECCDRMRDEMFGDGRRRGDDRQYHDRSTIFKVAKWSLRPLLPPTRGVWLIPIARSHAEPTSSSSFFWCPVDRLDFSQLGRKRRFSFLCFGFGEQRALGVAGSAFKKGSYKVEGLPDLLDVGWSDQSCQEYADKTFTYGRFVSSRRYVARSYFAKRIGLSERAPLGVVVFDCREEVFSRDAISIAAKYEKIIASLLGRPFDS